MASIHDKTGPVIGGRPVHAECEPGTEISRFLEAFGGQPWRDQMAADPDWTLATARELADRRAGSQRKWVGPFVAGKFLSPSFPCGICGCTVQIGDQIAIVPAEG